MKITDKLTFLSVTYRNRTLLSTHLQPWARTCLNPNHSPKRLTIKTQLTHWSTTLKNTWWSSKTPFNFQITNKQTRNDYCKKHRNPQKVEKDRTNRHRLNICIKNLEDVFQLSSWRMTTIGGMQCKITRARGLMWGGWLTPTCMLTRNLPLGIAAAKGKRRTEVPT